MKPVYDVILSKIGVNKHIPLAYRYGPTSYQVLSLPNLHTLQGIENIKMVLKHGGKDSQIRKYLCCIFEGHQLESGSLFPSFELSYKKYNSIISKSLIK